MTALDDIRKRVARWPQLGPEATLERDVARLLAIVDRLTAEREARHKCEAALRLKDDAMGVLFERLGRAGVDCARILSHDRPSPPRAYRYRLRAYEVVHRGRG